jgi:DNA polymerase III subunit alpha
VRKVDLLHTHVYSEYSLLSSTNRIEKLVSQAKKEGYGALALTDKGVMFGAIPFYKACLKAGIKPIIGLEVPIDTQVNGRRAHLRLLAENKAGYQSLLTISTELQMKSDKARFFTKEELLPHLDHCVVILSYDGGPVQEYVKSKEEGLAREWCSEWITLKHKGFWYIDLQGTIEKDRVFWQRISQFAASNGLKVIGSSPVLYTKKGDYEAYAAVRAIRLGTTIHLEEPNHEERFFYLRSIEEYQATFSECREALLGLQEIGQLCQLELDLDSRYLPAYPFTKKNNTREELINACLQGIDKRFGSRPTEEVTQRLEVELKVIDQMGFNDYFLIVSDFMRYARHRKMMTGPGRGSAAGSLVAYVLYITDVNPLEYDLLFERFLNPERITLPDIDIDFPDHRRDEVIRYVQEKYGHDRVAQIATFGTLAAKASVRDTGKVLSCDSYLIEKMAKLIPSTSGMTIKKAIQIERELKTLYQESKDAQRLLDIAQSIEGLMRHVSTHAAGVVISPVPLTELVALQRGQGQGVLTQATMGVVEEIGLVKFDFLGLRNLTLLERVVSIIEEYSGEVIDVRNLPIDDHKTYQLLAESDTTGVFQLESAGMRQVLRSLKPTEFEDIVAVNALYRPGPMEFINVYVEGKHKRRSISSPHPDLNEIIERTYGVIVYQEQIMQIVVKMAGFSLAEADLLRRAISKKNKHELEKSRVDFITGSIQKGYEEDVAKNVFQLIERFANYGFNRSHAVAYSMISYQLAYLKTHYPLAFHTALLSSVWNTTEKLMELLQESKRRKIDVLPPKLSKSGLLFTLENEAIRFGLLPISHVGIQAARHIIELVQEKPFKDLFDYCSRVNQRIVNRRATENLIKAGAMDEFKEDRAILLYNLDQAYAFAEKVQTFQDETAGLFTIDVEAPHYEKVDPLTLQERLFFEREALGVYVSGHPLEQVSEVLKKYQRINIVDLSTQKAKVRIAGLVSNLKKITTKKGDPMAFLEVGDETEQCEVTVFPDVWQQHGKMIKEGELLFMEGSLDHKRDKPQFILKRCVPVQSIVTQVKSKPTLYLKVVDPAHFSLVKACLLEDKGNTEVVVYLDNEKQTIKLEADYKVGPSEECMRALEELLGPEYVVLK